MVNRDKDQDIDITRNIKTLEWLKSQLLGEIANLFKGLVNGVKEEVRETVADSISNIIIVAYLLAKRLGITYNVIELKMEKKIRLGILEQHDVEKYYGDFTELSKHMNLNRGSEKG